MSALITAVVVTWAGALAPALAVVAVVIVDAFRVR
jgi:hypothetical protein